MKYSGVLGEMPIFNSRKALGGVGAAELSWQSALRASHSCRSTFFQPLTFLSHPGIKIFVDPFFRDQFRWPIRAGVKMQYNSERYDPDAEQAAYQAFLEVRRGCNQEWMTERKRPGQGHAAVTGRTGM